MNVRLRKLVEEGVVRGLIFTGVLQCPACLMTVGLDLEVLILSGGDAPVDLREACLKLFFQLRQMLFDRLIQDTQASLRDQLFLVLPSLVVEQVVLHAAETDAEGVGG